MQGNKEHDPIIGERTGTLTSADRIYPMDDWVGWHLQIHDPVFHCIALGYLSYKRLKCSKGAGRLCPVLKINLGPPTAEGKHPKRHAIEFLPFFGPCSLVHLKCLWSPYHDNRFLGLGDCGGVEQFSPSNPTIGNWMSILRHQVQRGQNQAMMIPFLLSEGLKLAAGT